MYIIIHGLVVISHLQIPTQERIIMRTRVVVEEKHQKQDKEQEEE